MPNESLLHGASYSNLSLDSFPDSTLENTDLTMEDYAKFSFIIWRLLELEEKYRLKTEEQYNAILEQQMDRFKVVESREQELRKKFANLSQKLFSNIETN